MVLLKIVNVTETRGGGTVRTEAVSVFKFFGGNSEPVAIAPNRSSSSGVYIIRRILQKN